MDSFLKKYLGGASSQGFFDRFGLDAIHWVVAHRPDESEGRVLRPAARHTRLPGSATGCDGQLAHRVRGDARTGMAATQRYRFVTPRGRTDDGAPVQRTHRVGHRASHQGEARHRPDRRVHARADCDVEAVNREAEAFGERGLVRGHICCFDVFGQPGCWQDAACLVGIEETDHGDLRRSGAGCTSS